jgi:hypothetical protein
MNIFLTGLMITMCFSGMGITQELYIKPFNIPDILNYKTLKCDFHIHTIFSDGKVWPDIRVYEAYKEDLDAIAITDHIEHRPFSNDVKSDHNRSYEIASVAGKETGITVIKAAEITHKMPPGHFNAIFLKDSNPLDTANYMAEIEIASNQGAFIFWNHPSYPHPENKELWSDVHQLIFDNGWMHGIEIVNSKYYYPKAHQWCLDKGLTMIGNSDIHPPITFDYDFQKGEHRPMTLIFAEENNKKSIRNALDSQRTAVIWNGNLIGKETYLKNIFKNSISIDHSDTIVDFINQNTAFIKIKNNSSISYHLKLLGAPQHIDAPKNLTLKANNISVLVVKANNNSQTPTQTAGLDYQITNLWLSPSERLNIKIPLLVLTDQTN